MVARRLLGLIASLVVLLSAPSLTRSAKAQGTPGSSRIQPLCVTGCQGGSAVSVTPSGAPDTVITGSNAQARFMVQNVGSLNDTYTLTMGCTGYETCVSQNQYSANLNPGARVWVTVTFTPGAENQTGVVSLQAADSYDYQSTGSYNVFNAAGAAPVVSLAPYLPTNQVPDGAVIYQASVPAIGSMGGQHSLTLVYSSATARPTAMVTVNVSNSGSPYPSAYELQVQRADNSVFLTLVNGATAVYYTAGTTTTTRLLAPVDTRASGLSTGSYPINVVVSAIYPLGPRSVTVSSRLLVNDQSASPLGAGVGLAEIPRLYPDPVAGTYGQTLVGAGGGAVYFARTCGTCTAFVSPPGVSSTLTRFSDPQIGVLYRLTALDSSAISDFDSVTGHFVRAFAPASVKAVAASWSNDRLTSVTDTTGRGFSLSYSGGILTQISDGGRTTSVWISSGLLRAVTTPDQLTDSLAYDGLGRLTRVRNPAGGVTTYVYSELNQLQADSGPAAVDYTKGNPVRPVSSLTTVGLVVWQPALPGTSGSPKGNVKPDTVMASATDALGNVTRTAEDRFGLATKIVDPLGQVTTISRDTLGHVLQSVEPNGHTITNQYGLAGYGPYLMNSTCDNTTGYCHAFAYDATHRVIIDSLGPQRLDYLYNGSGSSQGPLGTLRMVYGGATYHSDPMTNGRLLANHYRNAFGQDTLVLDAAGNRIRWIYASPSAGGNLDSTFDAKGHRTKYLYTAYGLVSTTTLANGWATSIRYDMVGRPDTLIDPLGGWTRYTYSPLGVTRVTNPNGETYRFDLNAWGLVTARHDLADSTKADSMWYDVVGRLRILKTRRSDVITMTYDALGRPLTRSGPDFPQQTYRYGFNGAWMVADWTYGHDSIAYDQAGRSTFTAQWLPHTATPYTMSYTYDHWGRPTSRTPSVGTTQTWVYNATLNVLDSLNALGVGVRIKRGAMLRADTLLYNGAWSHWQAFDSLKMMVHDSFSVSQLTADFAARWTYDTVGLGHVASAQTPNTGSLLPKNFTYDALGRLTNACTVNGSYCGNEYGGIGPAYGYDAAGNETSNGGVGLGNRYYVFLGRTLAYDPNGSVIEKAGYNYPGYPQDTTLYQWDALGELTRVEKWTGTGPHTVDYFSYDALGRRVVKNTPGVATRFYIYDGGRVVMDVDYPSLSVLAEYAYNASNDLFGMRTPSWTAVAINSPTIHTLLGLANASTGAEIKRYDVLATPWSQQSADTVVRFRMGGQEYDQETGLYHLGARYYDPDLHRFLSEDPAGIGGGLNLYVYANNDPIGASDPSGLAVPLPPAPSGGEDPCAFADSFGNSCLGSSVDGSVDWMDELDELGAIHDAAVNYQRYHDAWMDHLSYVGNSSLAPLDEGEFEALYLAVGAYVNPFKNDNLLYPKVIAFDRSDVLGYLIAAHVTSALVGNYKLSSTVPMSTQYSSSWSTTYIADYIFGRTSQAKLANYLTHEYAHGLGVHPELEACYVAFIATGVHGPPNYCGGY